LVAVKRTLSLIVLVAVVGGITPSLAFAHGPRGVSSGARGVHRRFTGQKSVFPQPVDPWKFWGVSPKHHNGDRHFGFTPFGGTSSFIGTPSVIVTTPPPAPIVIEIAPFVFAHPPMAAPIALPAPATLPTTTLIDHPDGWYQLRGDGAMTPYQWVWIPKPPEPPASAAPSAPVVRDPRGPAYQWTDDKGVTTWTNKLERVPKRFRDQAAASAQSD
jgi:hypothetical protein